MLVMPATGSDRVSGSPVIDMMKVETIGLWQLFTSQTVRPLELAAADGPLCLLLRGDDLRVRCCVVSPPLSDCLLDRVLIVARSRAAARAFLGLAQ